MNKQSLVQQKPTAPACERNRAPILSVLTKTFSTDSDVLEIGSGTGEHGVYFAEHMPWLQWQCSDLSENLNGINLWIEEAFLPNLKTAIELDVAKPKLNKKYNAFFTANTLHIMSKKHVEDFFDLISDFSHNQTDIIIYGPFNYDGNFTSESNAKFELWLKDRDPLSGIRDFEWIESLAKNINFKLIADHKMPANNRCLYFRKN